MDRYKLEYEIKKRNITIDEFCQSVGICRSAYYRKVNGKTEFTLGEINRIIEFLNLESPMDIFFPNKVS